MVSQDTVLKVMKEQPDKIWSVPEIASMIYRKDSRVLYSSYRSSIYEALKRLEKYGTVKKTYMKQIGSQWTRGWVLS